MRPLVIYHGGGCRDGWASAYLMSKAMPDAELLAANYGQPAPDVAGRPAVYVVDFSFPRDVLRTMCQQAVEVILLDHHRSAERALAPNPADPLPANCRVVFDMGKSGARLTWEYLWDRDLLLGPLLASNLRDNPHWLVAYVEDRDLWRWKLPDSAAVNAALRSYPLTVPAWDSLAARAPSGLVGEGEAILRAEAEVVAQHVRHAAEVEFDGFRVLCVNATTLISEVCHELAKGRPFGMSYFDRADGRRVYSLRSHPGGVDVSEVARRHGGGGHSQAAGFVADPAAVRAAA